jgi:hypothetical protein
MDNTERLRNQYGEYAMEPDRNDYRFLIERIDSMHQILDGKLDETRAQISGLTATVTNGLSHRTTQTERDVREIKATMATKAELQKILSDRQSADEAWSEARRRRTQMIITLVVGPPIGAAMTWGVQALITILGG